MDPLLVHQIGIYLFDENRYINRLLFIGSNSTDVPPNLLSVCVCGGGLTKFSLTNFSVHLSYRPTPTRDPYGCFCQQGIA